VDGELDPSVPGDLDDRSTATTRSPRTEISTRRSRDVEDKQFVEDSSCLVGPAAFTELATAI
jgi:hypothetical protein